MYVHAYQSYVWNAVVSERIRRYGSDAPVVGDLAYEKDEDDDADAEEPVELDYVGEEAEGFSHDTVAQNESLTRSGRHCHTARVP
jgi:tRNA(Glu) U13 pseudouridine synthase TruD